MLRGVFVWFSAGIGLFAERHVLLELTFAVWGGGSAEIMTADFLSR